MVTSSMMDVLSKVTPKDMKDAEEEDLDKGKVTRCVHAGRKPIFEKVPEGSIFANNPLHLLCIDFVKMDPSKNGKEHILIMMNIFQVHWGSSNTRSTGKDGRECLS